MHTSTTGPFLFSCLIRVIIIGTPPHRRLAGGDAVTLVVLLLYALLAVANVRLVLCPVDAATTGRKAQLTSGTLLKILKPCVWSYADAYSATLNHLRAMTTYACVFLSKGCVIASPLFLRRTSTSTTLARLQYGEVFRYSVYFAGLTLFESVFKECQGILSMANNSCCCVSVTPFLTSTYQLLYLYPTVTCLHFHNLSLY